MDNRLLGSGDEGELRLLAGFSPLVEQGGAGLGSRGGAGYVVGAILERVWRAAVAAVTGGGGGGSGGGSGGGGSVGGGGTTEPF
jgi:hypothetical protein